MENKITAYGAKHLGGKDWKQKRVYINAEIIKKHFGLDIEADLDLIGDFETGKIWVAYKSGCSDTLHAQNIKIRKYLKTNNVVATIKEK